jgi:aspartyl-tRNA(Asn)/glutamyl-tRNA(Gln) amidotransferase subunit B
MSWRLTVGMEIHVELETKTKMFCGCLNDPFHAAPNTHVCPVCYGLPGALPTLNKEAIKMVVRFGRAIHATIPAETFWARKNYFYPDLPKGYQISQSTAPLVQGGVIVIDGVEHHLHHAHLEEDAGKLMHSPDKSHSLVNFNRAGVPLLEIVTEPDFHSAETVKRFCQELQRIMRTLKISSADMEKGRMRCEANISVSNSEELGTKVEVKNINSFRAVEKAIEYEFDRQVKALEAGQTLVAETRTWNDAESKTVAMRSKETSADYRYFPEPDLPIVLVDEVDEGEHVLPEEQRQKLQEIGLPTETIQAVIDKDGYEFISELAQNDHSVAIDASKLFLAIPEFSELTTYGKGLIVTAKKEQGWSNVFVQQLIQKTDKSDKGLEVEITLRKGSAQTLDLPAAVGQVIAESPKPVADYKAGKEAAFQFLVGQVMAKTKGQGNIQHVREELRKALEA